MRIALAALATILVAGCAGPHGAGFVHGETPGAATAAAAPSPYAPYRFLVGEWNVGAEGAAPAAVARFRWGPGDSYLWFSVAMLAGRVEQPHFEGLLMWNGVRRNLDMLLTLDLAGGLSQEQGSMAIAPDGTVVRDITAYYSPGVRLPPRFDTRAPEGGATIRFRQTFRQEAPGRIRTALMRRDGEAWNPAFPGSDNLLMTPRG
jgi:hypothetical protein